MPCEGRHSVSLRGPHLLVIDRLGAGSGCACRGAVDPRLPQFAGDLEWLRLQGVQIEQVDPLGEPNVLRANVAAREHIEAGGVGSLPLLLVDGAVARAGSYPPRDELARLCGLA